MKNKNFDMSLLEKDNKETLLNKIYNYITKSNKLNFLVNNFGLETREIKSYIAQVL
jgi:hypothetical protein